VLYLGLAVATIGVLGTAAGSSAPLAALLRDAAGPAGTAAAAVAAVLLTLGAVNAYITGAAGMTRALIRPRAAGATTDTAPSPRPAPLFLAAVAVSGLALIALYGAGLVSPAALIALPTTLFLVVYLGCMASATRVLRGRARLAAAPATVIVAVVLVYCGWALLAPLAVILAIGAIGAWQRFRRPAALVGLERARRDDDPAAERARPASGLRDRVRTGPAATGTATAHPGHNSADSGVNLECQTRGVA
jgi:amino acid efflux transporter